MLTKIKLHCVIITNSLSEHKDDEKPGKPSTPDETAIVKDGKTKSAGDGDITSTPKTSKGESSKRKLETENIVVTITK